MFDMFELDISIDNVGVINRNYLIWNLNGINSINGTSIDTNRNDNLLSTTFRIPIYQTRLV
jgi:hypothetical protein